MEPSKLTVTGLAAEFGISKGHASQILSGDKEPSVGLACRIWRKTGVKLGRLKTADDSDMAVLERYSQ